MVNKLSDKPLSLDDYLTNEKRLCLNYPLYTDSKGKLLVDHVIKYENLNQELDTLFKTLGVPFHGSLDETANQSFRKKHIPYQEEISELQRQHIQRIFAPEIEMHRYTWE